METLANGQRPTITIDDDVEVIDLDCYIKPSEEIVKLWDEKIRRVVFEEQIYHKERGLNVCLREYIRSLEREGSIFEDKLLLKKKILSHIDFISLCYSDVCLKTIETAKYLDDMVEILTYYCNLELRCARHLKRKKNSSVESDKLIVEKWKSVAEHVCVLLTFYLMNSEKHIFHVLIKVNYDVKSRACQAIMDAVYWHFMIILPQTDDTEEAFCRYYLVLQKWKRIRDKEEYIMDIEKSKGAMEQRFPRLCFQKVLKDIFFPNKLNSVAIFSIIKNELEYYIKCYFNYIKNKEVIETDTTDYDLILDSIEVIEIQDDRNQQDDDIEFVSRTVGEAILISDEEDNRDTVSNSEVEEKCSNQKSTNEDNLLDQISQSHFNFDLTTNLNSPETQLNIREHNLLPDSEKDQCEGVMEISGDDNNVVVQQENVENVVEQQEFLEENVDNEGKAEKTGNTLPEVVDKQQVKVVVENVEINDQIMIAKQIEKENLEKLINVPAKSTKENVVKSAVETPAIQEMNSEKSKDLEVSTEMEEEETVKEKIVETEILEERNEIVEQQDSSDDIVEKLTKEIEEQRVEKTDKVVEVLVSVDKNLEKEKTQDRRKNSKNVINEMLQVIEDGNLPQEIAKEKKLIEEIVDKSKTIKQDKKLTKNKMVDEDFTKERRNLTKKSEDRLTEIQQEKTWKKDEKWEKNRDAQKTAAPNQQTSKKNVINEMLQVTEDGSLPQEIAKEKQLIEEIVDKSKTTKRDKKLTKNKMVDEDFTKERRNPTKKSEDRLTEIQQEKTSERDEEETAAPKRQTSKKTAAASAKKPPKTHENNPTETQRDLPQTQEIEMDLSRVVIEEYVEEDTGKAQEMELDFHAEARALEELCGMVSPAVVLVASDPAGKENVEPYGEKNVFVDGTVGAVPYEIEIVADAAEFTGFMPEMNAVGEEVVVGKIDGERTRTCSTSPKLDILKVAWDAAISNDTSNGPPTTDDDQYDSDRSADNFPGFEMATVNRQDQKPSNNNKPPPANTGILKKPNSTKRKREHSVAFDKSKRVARDPPRERPRMLLASLEPYALSKDDIATGSLVLPRFKAEELAMKHRLHMQRMKTSHVVRTAKVENGWEKVAHVGEVASNRNVIVEECERLQRAEQHRRQNSTLVKYDYRKPQQQQQNNGAHSGVTVKSAGTNSVLERRKNTEGVEGAARKRTDIENYPGSRKKSRNQHEQSQTGDPPRYAIKSVRQCRKRGRNYRTDSLSSAESSGSTKT